MLSDQKCKNGLAKGYINDESSHLKKGKLSVGVSRQYAGVAGKVDNCQVGVYASLVNHTSATIINQRIFLPKSWTQDTLRCKQADYTTAEKGLKTKPLLAIEMIKQDIERGVTFDWIGGDGLYEHSTELCETIDDMGLFFVLDVHKDETVFLQELHFEVPECKSKKGRAPENLKADTEALPLDRLQERIQPQDWKLEKIRDTNKGLLRLWVYKTDVWSWDNESMYPTKRTLIIITKTTEKLPKIKYSFSNGDLDEYTHKEYAYLVCQRYWVERTFDNAKNERGMYDCKVRKWKSWQHHHSLVMLASLFLMKQQVDNKTNVPLISFRDARILVILQVFGTKEDIQRRMLQMEKRHIKRQLGITDATEFNSMKNKVI